MTCAAEYAGASQSNGKYQTKSKGLSPFIARKALNRLRFSSFALSALSRFSVRSSCRDTSDWICFCASICWIFASCTSSSSLAAASLASRVRTSNVNSSFFLSASSSSMTWARAVCNDSTEDFVRAMLVLNWAAASELSLWINGLNKEETQEFERYRLGFVLFLRHIHLHWELLSAAGRCWDSKRHVFRFGTNELCPTIEEFSRILGVPTSGSMFCTMLRPCYNRAIGRFLGLKRKHEVTRLFHGKMLSLQALICFFRDRRLADVHIRIRALVLCVLGRFLLSSGGPYIHPCIVDVAEFLTSEMTHRPWRTFL